MALTDKVAGDFTMIRDEILADYAVAYKSRQASLIGRREVMSGKAKFGIFGGGKEVAQIAMAKVFQKGDFRSGYYRDQTVMLALGATDVQSFFAQLYAHADVDADPASAGRQMNAHFATRSMNPDGSWRNLTKMYNTSADISPTGSQMPRLVGLGYASRLYRELDELKHLTQFSRNGDEIAFGTIGNASCAEGMFWEAVNAIGVLRAPVLLSIWDDGYGISVPNHYQVTKDNISDLLVGFQRKPDTTEGFDIYTVPGWDYAKLVETYRLAADITRREHVPSIIHVTELTQPQGHSTSGSHERYKSKERLEWEREYDCMRQMRLWILDEGVATEDELTQIEDENRLFVEESRKRSWAAYQAPIKDDIEELCDILDEIPVTGATRSALEEIQRALRAKLTPYQGDVMRAAHRALLIIRENPVPAIKLLAEWKTEKQRMHRAKFQAHLYNESDDSTRNVPEVAPIYSDSSPMMQGYKIMNACFDAILAREPRAIAFGEDVGGIGDVNQGFVGLQKKYGMLRVSDTGIRETTIIGQAIGMALRGLRPIAEIQYLDYMLYALQIMSDDLATTHWRTHGGQIAPVIIRTRGHRLEGIWHAGSPMSGIVHLIRGIHVLVPRNMVQAAGFYNTLIRANDPALVVEVLNGYRIKEKLPDNMDSFTIPVGVPEIIRTGNDVTLVTYGASCKIASAAADDLAKVGIEVEIIDVRSLLPFDLPEMIQQSLQKTNRILFMDEDIPGGTTAFMMQRVLEVQGGYQWLDANPRTLSGKEHRPAYGSDGNYWSAPNAEATFEAVYEIMHEVDPEKYPLFFN